MPGQRLGRLRGAALTEPRLTVRDTVQQWWPLAAGWVLMTAELTVLSALVARMPSPAVQLAAWGVAFALSTLVQAPSTALLPTATALARDRRSLAALARYGVAVIALLTALHALVALTPLYGFVVRGLMGVPEEVAEQARTALIVMLPWTFGTGARRFLQGVMIRLGASRVVILGAVLRLSLGTSVMLIGKAMGWASGAQLAAVAIISAVLLELGYNVVRFAAVTRGRLPARLEDAEGVALGRFLAFYLPLVLMTVLTMFVQTLVTVALGRMPSALESLAVWPVLFSFIVILQSPGMAFTEVAISLLGRRGAGDLLRRVAWWSALGLTGMLVAVAATPLARLWFGGISGLPPDLTSLAVVGLWLGLAVPGLRLLMSWYQGVIIHAERTRGILESVLVFLAAGALLLGAGIAWGAVPGLYAGMVALTVAMLAQVVWLAVRAAPFLRSLALSDSAAAGGAA